jgi:hypothetical protein
LRFFNTFLFLKLLINNFIFKFFYHFLQILSKKVEKSQKKSIFGGFWGGQKNVVFWSFLVFFGPLDFKVDVTHKKFVADVRMLKKGPQARDPIYIAKIGKNRRF